jgi:hypothetical protein
VKRCGRHLGGAFRLRWATSGPEVAEQLKEAGRQLRRERRAAAVRGTAEREQERHVQRQAQKQAALERAITTARAALAATTRRRRRSGYEAWLDEHDARLPWTRADLRSASDALAAGAVAGGGGIAAVIEATGLRTRENVMRLIEPAILVEAFANDGRARAAAAAAPDRARLRRLHPDPELVRRRAAGEPLRRLAADASGSSNDRSARRRRSGRTRHGSKWLDSGSPRRRWPPPAPEMSASLPNTSACASAAVTAARSAPSSIRSSSPAGTCARRSREK